MVDQDFIQNLQHLRDNLLTILNVSVDSVIRQLEEMTPQEPMEFSLSMPSSFFKGKKPTAVIFPDGRETAVSNWKQTVSTIFDDAAKDNTILDQLYHMRNRVYGRSRLLLGDSPSAMNQPLKIVEGLFFESKFDTESLLNVLAKRIFKPTGYDFGAIRLRIKVE